MSTGGFSNEYLQYSFSWENEKKNIGTFWLIKIPYLKLGWSQCAGMSNLFVCTKYVVNKQKTNEPCCV